MVDLFVCDIGLQPLNEIFNRGYSRVVPIPVSGHIGISVTMRMLRWDQNIVQNMDYPVSCNDIGASDCNEAIDFHSGEAVVASDIDA